VRYASRFPRSTRGRRSEMSDSSGKQAADAPSFTAQDAMAFMQKMWNPFTMPMPGSASGAVSVTEPVPPPAAAPAQPTAESAMSGMMQGLMPGMLPFPNPAAMFAALDPVEVERKIGELRIIEGWLTMSLNMIRMSIKTLELQHASLEALHAARAPAKKKSEAKSRKS
jgi:hypothetical protein